MKKTILFMFGVLFSLFANAQFKATKNGVSTIDGKDYYVVEVDGKTAQELFESVEGYIMSNFKNPDAVINKQKDKMINIHGIFTDAVPCNKVGKHINYADIDLNLIIYFKDGRMRFDIPVINSIKRQMPDGDIWEYHFYEKGLTGQMFGVFSLFKKNGEVKNEYAVNGFNTFINELINDIVVYAKGQSFDENW